MHTLHHRERHRPTPSYSLDEVAKLRRMIAGGGEHITCPDCHHPLDPRVGRDHDTTIWVVRCHVCGRGVVMQVESEGIVSAVQPER